MTRSYVFLVDVILGDIVVRETRELSISVWCKLHLILLLLFIIIIHLMYCLSVNNVMQKRHNPMNQSADREAFIINCIIIIIINNISHL